MSAIPAAASAGAARGAVSRPPAITAAQCPDMEDAFVRLYESARPFTMTGIERMYALYQAVRHVQAADIEGDFVECGVWRGGSAMLMASTLLQLHDTSRRLWLYDTFEGMAAAGDADIDYTGTPAATSLQQRGLTSFAQWCHASLDDVQHNLASTGYPSAQVRYVQGKVEQTIPEHTPDQIALLRLDTDWYESTRHELEHLYPRLARGGVIIIDDYGHWQGCRRAVDEYFRDKPILLQRIDYTGRMAVKP